MPARAGQPFDRFDEVELLELTDERDRIATFLAPEAVPREDVVFEHERVRAFDHRAEDLLDTIRFLDRLHDPAAPVEGLPGVREAATVLGQQEEVFDQVCADEMHPVQIARTAVNAESIAGS